MDIELRTHVGLTEDGAEITFAQDQIFVDGVRFGYVPHAPVPPLLWIRKPSAAIAGAVRKLVADRGDIAGRNVEVPSITGQERLDELEGVTTKKQRDDDV